MKVEGLSLPRGSKRARSGEMDSGATGREGVGCRVVGLPRNGRDHVETE